MANTHEEDQKGETEEKAGDPHGCLQSQHAPGRGHHTTAAEAEQHEFNNWDDCSEKIIREEEPSAVSCHGDGAEQLKQPLEE